MAFPRKRFLTAIAAAVWLAAAVYGMKMLADYSLAPGDPGTPESHWPEASGLERAPDRFTLVLGLHPECSCSRATVEELNSILARCGDSARVIAVFSDAGPKADPVENSKLWKDIGRFASVARVKDPDGAEARNFSLQTSGAVRLFAPDGSLRYRGGITGARGHAGDNAARRAVVAAILGDSSASAALPVFGCGFGGDDNPDTVR